MLKKLTIVASVVLIAVVSLFAVVSQAATSTATVVEVGYRGDYGGQVSLVLSNSVTAYAQGIAPDQSCSGLTNTPEALRNLQALLTTALVSGREVRVEYTTCVAYNYITKVSLK